MALIILFTNKTTARFKKRNGLWPIPFKRGSCQAATSQNQVFCDLDSSTSEHSLISLISRSKPTFRVIQTPACHQRNKHQVTHSNPMLPILHPTTQLQTPLPPPPKKNKNKNKNRLHRARNRTQTARQTCPQKDVRPSRALVAPSEGRPRGPPPRRGTARGTGRCPAPRPPRGSAARRRRSGRATR